jgi:hypothetical protein
MTGFLEYKDVYTPYILWNDGSDFLESTDGGRGTSEEDMCQSSTECELGKTEYLSKLLLRGHEAAIQPWVDPGRSSDNGIPAYGKDKSMDVGSILVRHLVGIEEEEDGDQGLGGRISIYTDVPQLNQ